VDAAGAGALTRNLPMIQRLGRIDNLSDASQTPQGGVVIPVDGGSFCLPLADVIDIAAEQTRLEKAIAKLDKELGGIEAKLGNEKFTANAPAHVVAENRERLEAGGAERKTLDAALTRLRALG